MGVDGGVLVPPPPQPTSADRTNIANRPLLRMRKVFRICRRSGSRKRDATPRPARRMSETARTEDDCVAVVLTVTVKFPDPPVLRLMLAGLMEQEAFCGAPPQLNVIVPLKPAAPINERL